MNEWIKNNVSVLITIVTLASGGFASYVRIQDQLSLLSGKVATIEKDGTEKQRVLESKVSGLELQNNNLAEQMKEQREVLTRIDQRVKYLLCKNEKRFCLE